MTKPQPIETFCDEARQMGALDAVVISPPRQVFTAAWVRLRCQYGCSEYGQCLTCPPHSPTPETTRKVLDEYQSAILLHGANWESVRDIARTLERRGLSGRLLQGVCLRVRAVLAVQDVRGRQAKAGRGCGVQASRSSPTGDGGRGDRRLRHGPCGRVAYRGGSFRGVPAELLCAGAGGVRPRTSRPGCSIGRRTGRRQEASAYSFAGPFAVGLRVFSLAFSSSNSLTFASRSF